MHYDRMRPAPIAAAIAVGTPAVLPIVAMTHNPDLHAFAQRLRTKGKITRAVITAVLRQRILRASTLVAENSTWTPERP